MQSVGLSVVGNILTLTTFSECDQDFLDRGETREKIDQALNDFLPFELQVELDEKEKNLDEIDEESKRLKEIFGQDIVIIKNN